MANWNKRFLDMAELVASWSKDPSTKCGAVIVRPNKTVASVGFNGFPRGMNDDFDLYEDRERKYSRIVHAEINAILFAKESLDFCTLYTYPLGTCDRCAAQVIQSGISEVVAPVNTIERWEEQLGKAKDMYTEAGVIVNWI